MAEGSVTVTNRIPALRARLRENIQLRLHALAAEGAEMCREAVESGSAGITSDTGALAASFYVESNLASGGYEEAVSDMLDNYTMRYPMQHGLNRVAPPIEIGPMQSAFASSSKVMAWWEYGHQNLFTGSFEKAPVLRPAREEMRLRASRAFRNLLK